MDRRQIGGGRDRAIGQQRGCGCRRKKRRDGRGTERRFFHGIVSLEQKFKEGRKDKTSKREKIKKKMKRSKHGCQRAKQSNKRERKERKAEEKKMKKGTCRHRSPKRNVAQVSSQSSSRREHVTMSTVSEFPPNESAKHDQAPMKARSAPVLTGTGNIGPICILLRIKVNLESRNGT